LAKRDSSKPRREDSSKENQIKEVVGMKKDRQAARNRSRETPERFRKKKMGYQFQTEDGRTTGM